MCSLSGLAVLIESDWNLKQFGGGYNPPVPDRINRIRLEFKVSCPEPMLVDWELVLIESDWNLKFSIWLSEFFFNPVLIESDWNLKQQKDRGVLDTEVVLIESDWNLKMLNMA